MNRDELARTLLDTMPDAVIVSDADGTISHWNGGAERIFGFSEAEALGQSLDIIIPENLRARHWKGYDQTMRTGMSRYGAGDLLSVPALREDGARISVQFSIVPLKDADGTMTGMAAIMRDITADFEERKRMRKELAEKSKT